MKKNLFPDLSPTFPTNRLRHARRARNLTQTQLSSQVGISQGWLSQIELGEALWVKTDLQRRLSRALRVSRRWLFDKDGHVRL